VSDRLEGFLLILAGCTIASITYLAQQYLLPLIAPPAPPGLPPGLTATASPITCVLPLIFLGSIGLCLVGAKKLLFPDDWQPPKHLG
jgi:hypothetical protein